MLRTIQCRNKSLDYNSNLQPGFEPKRLLLMMFFYGDPVVLNFLDQSCFLLPRVFYLSRYAKDPAILNVCRYGLANLRVLNFLIGCHSNLTNQRSLVVQRKH